MSMLRLMIVDDHPLFRRGVRQLVDMDPSLVVVGEASDGAEAVRKAVDLQPNLILLDLNMQPIDGIEVLRRMRDARVKSRIVILTVSDSDDDVVRALVERRGKNRAAVALANKNARQAWAILCQAA